MISFPKKSFYFQSEVLELLNITTKELKSFCLNGLESLFSDNGKKIFLREDIINLYAQGIVVEAQPEILGDKLVNQTEQTDFISQSQLANYKESIEGALSFISQIKSNHPQIWYN